MKSFMLTALFFLAVAAIPLQAQTPAKIILKSGETVLVHDFAQVDCNGTLYFDNYVLIKGWYQGNLTEVKSYKDIDKIELIGFEAEPLATGSNEKAKITITKSNGISVTLTDAEIGLSCYGVNENYNQLRLATVNPLTNKKVETPVNTKDIDYIIFD